MATITLKDGDFGGDATVIVGEAALYLPDRTRPGLNEAVPLTEIAEIETLTDDRSGQLKEAMRLGAKGFFATGNPLGLAAGVLAVRKVKDVEFSVRLNDGRSFVAVADAGTLADLRAGSRPALLTTGEDDEAAARADAVIAKYLGADAQPLDPATPEGPGEMKPDVQTGPREATPTHAVFGRRRR